MNQKLSNFGTSSAFVAILLTVLAMAGSLFISKATLEKTARAVEDQIQQLYLVKAQSLASLSVAEPSLTDTVLLATIEEMWASGATLPRDEYICIVDGAGRLLLHSQAPESVGNNASRNILGASDNRAAQTLGELVQSSGDYVGEYTSSSGTPQIAAFAPISNRGWFIGVHRSKDALQKRIKDNLKGQYWAMLFISFGVIPFAQLLLFLWIRRINRNSHKLATSLHAVEETFQSIIKSSIEGFWMTNTQGQFIDVNTSYLKMSGYSREDFLKLKIADVEAIESPEETHQRIQSPLKNVKVILRPCISVRTEVHSQLMSVSSTRTWTGAV